MKVEKVIVKDETIEEENKALQRKVTELESRLQSQDLAPAEGSAASSGDTQRL